MVQRSFTHGGFSYTAHSQIVDTDYGPENRVLFKDAAGIPLGVWTEAASLSAIITWFCEMLDAEAWLREEMDHEHSLHEMWQDCGGEG